MRKGFIYKMYNKNGNFTPVAQAIYNKNMERLRAGDNPLDIAKSMKEQVQLVEYNGPMEKIYAIGKQGWYWYVFHVLATHEPIKPRKPMGVTTGRMSSFPVDWYIRTPLMPLIR